MAASELLCRAHSSSAQRSRPPVTSPRRLHPARGGRHHPWVTATAHLSLPPPSPSDSSPPPGLIRGVQRPPRTNMGTHPGIADPDAAAAVPVAPLPPTCFTADSKREAAKGTSPSCSRQAWLAACWGVVFVCVVYSLSTQCIVSEQRTIKTTEKPRSPGSPPPTIFGLSLLKNDVKRPLAASTRRAPGRSPLRRAARARVARASDRHRSPLRALCPRTADAQARGRARAVALRTPPSTRARSRTSPVTLYSEQRRCACTPFPRHMHFGGRK